MKKKLLAVVAIGMFILSCEKTPDNPYDTVNYDTDTTTDATVDPNSFVGLHHSGSSYECVKCQQEKACLHCP